MSDDIDETLDESRMRDTHPAPPEDNFPTERSHANRALPPFSEIPGAPEWAQALYRRDHEERSIVLDAIQDMRAAQRQILANQETTSHSVTSLRTSTEGRFRDHEVARDELASRVRALELWRTSVESDGK